MKNDESIVSIEMKEITDLQLTKDITDRCQILKISSTEKYIVEIRIKPTISVKITNK